MTSSENMEDFVKTSREELSIQWRIPNFFSQSYEGGEVDFESPNFHFCGTLWSFELYTYFAEDSPDSAELNLYLNREEDKEIDNPSAIVNFMMGIIGPEGIEMKIEDELKFSDDFLEYHKWPNFLSLGKLREHKDRLVPNDVLTFTCEMKKNVLSSVRGVEKLQKSLRSMLMSGEDCDIIFKVQGKEFPAHRIILKARSPVFRAMFAHDMVEKQSGEVAIDDCDPQVFSNFLDHVYTGSSEKINQGNVFELYTISDKYEMDTLKEQCVDCMKRNLSVASFCDVMKLALKHDNKELVEFTTQFFCSNTSDIVVTSDWPVFYEENSAFGYKLLIKTLTK